MSRSQYEPSHRWCTTRLRGLTARALMLVVAGLLPFTGLSCPPAEPDPNVIFSHDIDGIMYKVNVDTRTATLIGDSGVELYDIAFDDQDRLYGISRQADFYLVNQTTGEASLIGDTGLGTPNSLYFDTELQLMWCGTLSGNLATINRNTGVGTVVNDIFPYTSSGDITLGADGRLLMSTRQSVLIAIDRDNFEIEEIGDLPSNEVWALERLPDGRLFGITSANLIYLIDETTAESELQGALEADFDFGQTGGGSFPN